MKVSQQIKINSTPDAVFAYLMDIDNRKDFIPQLDDVILLDPLPIQEGSRYIEVAKIAGRNFKTTYQVTSYKENEYVIAETIKSIFPIKAQSSVSKNGNNTILQFDLEFTLRGVFKFASGIIKGIVRQQTLDILDNIKRGVEE